MTDKTYSWIGGFLVGVAIGGFIFAVLVHKDMREEAVKAGVAEYVTNEDGSPKFVYKTVTNTVK